MNRMFELYQWSWLAGLLAGLSCATAPLAEDHTEQALQHAEAAARSTGDSAAIREHATEALKHIEAAKAANAGNPETLKILEQSEKDLRHAVTHARHYNSTSAGREASDAEHHLELIREQESDDGNP